MENKYQEALEGLVAFAHPEQYCKEDYATLQKLVDKEKAMKPREVVRGRSGNIKYKSTQYYCPKCSFEVSKSYHNVFTPNKNNFCPNCGQKLDWSDSND